jgi:quinol monooxygenase YgiN
MMNSRVKEITMDKVALWVRLEAKQGKEKELETFLKKGLSLAQDEPATTTWFALRLGPTSFGIFDSFPDNSGRDAHLNGPIAAALISKAEELLERPPMIEKVEILAAKIP